MEKYKCIKEFELPFFDEDGRVTEGIHTISKGSIWEYAHDYKSNSDVRMYLIGGNSDFEYIDITYESMEKYFVRVA